MSVHTRIEWDEEISIYGRDFPTLQRRIKKNAKKEVLQIWKIFSHFDIHCGGEGHVRIVHVVFVCYWLCCVELIWLCCWLVVCGLDKIGQERNMMKWNCPCDSSNRWPNLLISTKWRGRRDTSGTRSPRFTSCNHRDLAMPTTDPIIVKMVLEIDWMFIRLARDMVHLESDGVENQWQRKKNNWF